MNRGTTPTKRVLALDPHSRGLGFVVLEGAEHLIDWGLKDTRRDNSRRGVHHVERLVETYHPDVLVLEAVQDPLCRRCVRVRTLLQSIGQLAAEKKLRMKSFSRHAVQ